jgi:two-component system sensor histidine kinase YesM
MVKWYLNMRIRYKIFILSYTLIVTVTLTLGFYSFQTSKKQIVNKVSTTNLGVIKEVDNNLAILQKNIADWVTVFSLASEVQDVLRKDPAQLEQLESVLYNGPMASIMNQMLITRNFDFIAMYGNGKLPLFQESSDDSSGANDFEKIKETFVYRKSLELKGASYWFPFKGENSMLIQDNRNEKLGMSRIIRDTVSGRTLGFIFVGINEQTIRNNYLKNLYDDDYGIVILDEQGQPILTAGKVFYEPDSSQFDFMYAQKGLAASSKVVHVNKEDLLLSYSAANENGWRILYAVPLGLLTKELNSIKLFVLVLILACLLLSIPFMMILSFFLTAPIKTLLASMKRFENGRFDERVDIKYKDEIGELSRGYNSMVSNIRSLVDDVYLLQIKEKEAELKALQSQINPHFLYNMLDTIFWEAEAAGQSKISDMVVALSRLFRLSLNRGKSYTSVAKEKELIELYLSLQKMRFQDLLTYEIDMDEALDSYIMLKLSLQPFIENALVHGIEKMRGGGYVRVSGIRKGDLLHFTIEDNGPGMSEELLGQILELPNESDIYTAKDTGGYAIQNVNARLKHYYKEGYQLNYSSELGRGTRVELIIPAVLIEERNEKHDSYDDRR